MPKIRRSVSTRSVSPRSPVWSSPGTRRGRCSVEYSKRWEDHRGGDAGQRLVTGLIRPARVASGHENARARRRLARSRGRSPAVEGAIETIRKCRLDEGAFRKAQAASSGPASGTRRDQDRRCRRVSGTSESAGSLYQPGNGAAVPDDAATFDEDRPPPLSAFARTARRSGAE